MRTKTGQLQPCQHTHLAQVRSYTPPLMDESGQKQPVTSAGWPLVAAGVGLAVLTAAGAAAWYLAQPATSKSETAASRARADRISERRAKRQGGKAATDAAEPPVHDTKFPTRPTSADLHEALVVLGDTDPRSKQAIWRSCGVLAILSGHGKAP